MLLGIYDTIVRRADLFYCAGIIFSLITSYILDQSIIFLFLIYSFIFLHTFDFFSYIFGQK